MKVQDVMTSKVRSCGPETNLAEAVKMMWENDCGILPVVDSQSKILSAITDRDIAIAVGTRSRLAADIPVVDVMPDLVVTAAPDEDLRSALRTMKTALVRRLPVTDRDGVLRGILSINDIVLWAANNPTAPSAEDVVSTLKAICQHHRTRVAAAR